jgi:hypothetical protein
MKTRALTTTLALLLLAGVAASTADAGTVKLSNRPGSPGGEFLATVVDGTGIPGHVDGDSFITFCLEKSEYITFGREYDVVVSTAAKNGGGGSVNGQDPLDVRTAWLYSLVRSGTLTSYDYSAARTTANELQEAFWFLEQEIGSVDGLAQTWVGNANTALANGDITGLGNVRVMNLTYQGAQAQDQLIMVPLPTSLAAGAMVLAALGVAYVRRARLRRRLL